MQRFVSNLHYMGKGLLVDFGGQRLYTHLNQKLEVDVIATTVSFVDPHLLDCADC